MSKSCLGNDGYLLIFPDAFAILLVKVMKGKYLKKKRESQFHRHFCKKMREKISNLNRANNNLRIPVKEKEEHY